MLLLHSYKVIAPEKKSQKTGKKVVIPVCPGSTGFMSQSQILDLPKSKYSFDPWWYQKKLILFIVNNESNQKICEEKDGSIPV